MISLPVHRSSNERYAGPRVRSVMVYLTEDCNLRCGYCFVHKRPRRMSAETADRLVEFLLRRDLAPSEETVQVNFFGGEPFLELDRMEQIVREATRYRPNRGRNFVFSATTNGTLCSSRLRRLIHASRMRLLISLDGGAEVTAEERPFLNGRSSHQLVLRNLPLLMEASPEVTVRTTFTPRSHDLVSRVRALIRVGAPSIVLSPVLELPWVDHVDSLEAAYRDLADWYLENAGPEQVPALEVTNGLLCLWHLHRRGRPRPVRSCPVGHSLIGIDPDGNVMPCHRFLYRPQDHLGTLEDPGLLSEARRPYAEFDSSRLPDCSTCAAEPVCGGGCRVVALQKNVGLDGVYDSHCITMRAHRDAVVRIYDALEERGWLGAVLRQRTGAAESLADPVYR